MKIQRIQTIESELAPKRALIVYGPRRIGKTTLVEKFAENHREKRILFVVGDDTRLQQLLNSGLRKEILEWALPNEIIIIDEAQYILNIGLAIKMVIDAYPEKILNLHPGIIPVDPNKIGKNPDGTKALWNKGMFTGSAIQNVLSKNATYAGSSVHFLTHEFDFGPVLGKTFEKTRPGDTIESLYTRLKKKENTLYVKVLQKLCN